MVEYKYVEIVRANILKSFDFIDELKHHYKKEDAYKDAYKLHDRFYSEVESNWRLKIQKLCKNEITNNLFSFLGSETKMKNYYIKSVLQKLSDEIQDKLVDINKLIELKRKEIEIRDRRNLGTEKYIIASNWISPYELIDDLRTDLFQTIKATCDDERININFIGICDELKIELSLVKININDTSEVIKNEIIPQEYQRMIVMIDELGVIKFLKDKYESHSSSVIGNILSKCIGIKQDTIRKTIDRIEKESLKDQYDDYLTSTFKSLKIKRNS